MKRPALVLASAFFAASIALAADPPATDAVDLKLVVDVGHELRFRQTESSSMEVGGKAQKASELSQDYAVTVKVVRPDGGADVDVVFENVRRKQLMRRTGEWTEIDTSKPAPDGADMQVKMLDAVARAMVGRPFRVVLDARGAPTAVSGVRELMKEGLKGTPFENLIPVEQIFTDAECMKLGISLFAGAPKGPQSVGSKWTAEETAEVAGQWLDFGVESTLTAAAESDATVAAKYVWKPGAEAKAGDAKPEGGGESTTKFSRKDGFLVSMKRHLEANRETPQTKATSHTDVAIERLPPAEKKPAEETKPATPPEKK
jgi:hypothetical protein